MFKVWVAGQHLFKAAQKGGVPDVERRPVRLPSNSLVGLGAQMRPSAALPPEGCGCGSSFPVSPERGVSSEAARGGRATRQ